MNGRLILMFALLVFSFFVMQEAVAKLNIYVNLIEGQEEKVSGDILLIRLKVEEPDQEEVIDREIIYSLEDFEGVTINKVSETVGFRDELERFKEIKIPYGLETGDYVLVVSVNNLDGKSKGESKSLFRLEEETGNNLGSKEYVIFGILAIVFFIFVLLISYEHKKFKAERKDIKIITEEGLRRNK